MPSVVPVDRWEGVDRLQFLGQAYPTHALLDSCPVRCWPIHTGDIFRLKAFVYNVCTNDIPIDVACHRYTLNMQISSGTKNHSSANEPSCTSVTVSFNGVLFGGNGYLTLSILKSGENQTAN
ncbi:uncharacterized protein TNCV_3794191 [Trichonephila clavipes]|nr:uncharacterized protein TNCV_3794191 [Trichonephila clavipes]